MERRGSRGPAPTHPCGTNAAYRRHLRWGEEACEKCLLAHAVYQKAWRGKRADMPEVEGEE